MRILICEDNLVIAMDLEMIVEDMGHASAGLATTSAECLALCRAQAPDLVLVDLDLADGPTGPGLTRDLAAMGIESVIVSGQTEALVAGEHAARAVVGKPVDEAALRAAIEGRRA